MLKFSHDDKDAKAIAIPRVFSKNSRAEKKNKKLSALKLHFQDAVTPTFISTLPNDYISAHTILNYRF